MSEPLPYGYADPTKTAPRPFEGLPQPKGQPLAPRPFEGLPQPSAQPSAQPRPSLPNSQNPTRNPDYRRAINPGGQGFGTNTLKPTALPRRLPIWALPVLPFLLPGVSPFTLPPVGSGSLPGGPYRPPKTGIPKEKPTGTLPGKKGQCPGIAYDGFVWAQVDRSLDGNVVTENTGLQEGGNGVIEIKFTLGGGGRWILEKTANGVTSDYATPFRFPFYISLEWRGERVDGLPDDCGQPTPVFDPIPTRPRERPYADPIPFPPRNPFQDPRRDPSKDPSGDPVPFPFPFPIPFPSPDPRGGDPFAPDTNPGDRRDPVPLPEPRTNPGGGGGGGGGNPTDNPDGGGGTGTDTGGDYDPPPKEDICDSPCIKEILREVKKPPCPPQQPCPEIDFPVSTVECQDGEPQITAWVLKLAKPPPMGFAVAIERMATAAAKGCQSEPLLAFPDWWQTRIGAERPQIVVAFRHAGKTKYSPVAIPHPRDTTPWTSNKLGNYVAGSWSGVLVLKDNSKVVINCVSQAEAERMIAAAVALIKPEMLDTPLDVTYFKRGGRAVQEIARIGRTAQYFATGQRDIMPTWRRSFTS